MFHSDISNIKTIASAVRSVMRTKPFYWHISKILDVMFPKTFKIKAAFFYGWKKSCFYYKCDLRYFFFLLLFRWYTTHYKNRKCPLKM